jgi:predicted transcriptional regulator
MSNQSDTAILCDERTTSQLDTLKHSLNLVQHRQIYEVELLEKVDTASESQKQQIETSSARTDASLEKISSQFDEFRRDQNDIARQVETLVCDGCFH